MKLGQEGQAAEQDRRAKEIEMNQLSRDLDTIRNTRTNLDGRLKDKYNAFGKNIPRLIEVVKREQWAGETPIGPLGAFVELKDPRWAYPARVALQNHMSSWIISTTKDRAKLQNLLAKSMKYVGFSFILAFRAYSSNLIFLI